LNGEGSSTPAPSCARVIYDYYGGGGHNNVGTCQVPDEKAEQVLSDLILKLKD